MEGIGINIGNPFVPDNDRFKMRPALDHMVDSAHLDICTVFLDAYGVCSIGSAAENGELRLLVGVDLTYMPVAQDSVTFQMAGEWKSHLLTRDPQQRGGVRCPPK